MGKETLYGKIHARAGELRDYTAENLTRLVRIPSVSGSEGAVAEELRRQMTEAGFDDVAVDPLGNVIGRIGHGYTLLALDAHIDTVDAGAREEWDFDPYCGEIRDGFVLGRGSVDQKGGAAAMVTAGRLLKEHGVPDDLTLLAIGSVMEEECEGLCWRYIVEEDNIRPDVVVSTEPTNRGVYRGQRGRIEIEVTFHGVPAHGSAPDRGKNAIYTASKACLAVEKLNEHLADDELLGKASITVTEFVSGSRSLCNVPDSARIHLDRRLTWSETKGAALNEIAALVDHRAAGPLVPQYQGKSYTGTTYGMEKYYPTWAMPEDHPAVVRGAEVYEKLFGTKARIGTWGLSTNGISINGIYGIPTIGYGPGDESYAHAPNEKIPIDDLVPAAAFYAAYTYAMGEKQDEHDTAERALRDD